MSLSTSIAAIVVPIVNFRWKKFPLCYIIATLACGLSYVFRIVTYCGNRSGIVCYDI